MDKSNDRKKDTDLDANKRNFLYIATGAVAAIGVSAAAWPFVTSMNPGADDRAMPRINIDLRKIPEGSEIKVHGRARGSSVPIFIRHRTPEEIIAARDVDLDDLRHTQTDEDRLRPRPDGTIDPRFLVVTGICSHFGGVLAGKHSEKTSQGRFGGWYCPNHGADFDTSGRVRRGPARKNMDIPPYRYLTNNIIEIFSYGDPAFKTL